MKRGYKDEPRGSASNACLFGRVVSTLKIKISVTDGEFQGSLDAQLNGRGKSNK